jgi:hypothetical protein
MMNYVKGKNVEEELTKEGIPIENLPKDFLWMLVSFRIQKPFKTLAFKFHTPFRLRAAQR